MKRSALQATQSLLATLEMKNSKNQPTHPIARLQRQYEATDLLLERDALAKRAMDVTSEVENTFDILWVQKLEKRGFEKRNVALTISDPLFPAQYHLKKYSTAKASLNVTGVWDLGYTGNGVTIAIVDDGLQHTHPDLTANYKAAGSYNFDYNRADPGPTSMRLDYHGTSCAGTAAAVADGAKCGVGVALNAGVSGVVILQRDTLDDAKASRALQYALVVNHIYSNSWGPADGGNAYAGPGALTKQALALGIHSGRNGRGAIYTWAAGNGGLRDNCNYDGYANARHVITVGAIDAGGFKSSFSEECAAITVVAPSNTNMASYIRTTDLLGANGHSSTDCNEVFAGTSASCPAVAGVVALILEAHPGASWLDVQKIVIETAIKTDAGSTSWALNGAGFWVSHSYGFGLIDAYAAVQRAIRMKNDPHEVSMDQEVMIAYQSTTPIAYTTLDGTRYGVRISIPVIEYVIIHHVELVVTIRTPDAGKLDISLRSPSGTQSVLAKSHQTNSANLNNWIFTSRFQWGEPTLGTWTFDILDSSNTGSLQSYSLRMYGTPNALIGEDVVKVLQGDSYLSTAPPSPTPPPTPVAAPTSAPPPVMLPPAPVAAPKSATPTPSAESSPYITIAVLATIIAIVVVAVVAFGFLYWYRRNHTPATPFAPLTNDDDDNELGIQETSPEDQDGSALVEISLEEADGLDAESGVPLNL